MKTVDQAPLALDSAADCDPMITAPSIPFAIRPAAVNLIGFRETRPQTRLGAEGKSVASQKPAGRDDTDGADFVALLTTMVQTGNLHPTPSLPILSAVWPGLSTEASAGQSSDEAVSATSAVEQVAALSAPRPSAPKSLINLSLANPLLGSPLLADPSLANPSPADQRALANSSLVSPPLLLSAPTASWSSALTQGLSRVRRPSDSIAAVVNVSDAERRDSLGTSGDTHGGLPQALSQTPFGITLPVFQETGAAQQPLDASNETGPLTPEAISGPHASPVVEPGVIFKTTGNEHIEVSLQTPEIGSVWLQVRESEGGIEARLEAQTETTMRILQIALDTIRERVESVGVELGSLTLGFRQDGNHSDHMGWTPRLRWPTTSFREASLDENQSAAQRIESAWRGQINMLA